MKNLYSEFLKFIQFYIDINDINVTRFAKQVGCRERCIARWLNGTNCPSTEYIIKVADSLNISVDYLFGRSKQPDYISANPRSSIAERLQSLVKISIFNRRQLSFLWGIEPSLLSKWMRGARIPKPDAIYKIADCFGCSMDYLLGRTDLR